MKLSSTVIIGLLFLKFTTLCFGSTIQNGQANLINQYGEWQCYSNLWVIADSKDKTISIKYLEGRSSFNQTAKDWKTGPGWFIYSDDPHLVWIYNGRSLRLLKITPGLGSTIYAQKYPCIIPAPVKLKLDVSPSDSNQ